MTLSQDMVNLSIQLLGNLLILRVEEGKGKSHQEGLASGWYIGLKHPSELSRRLLLARIFFMWNYVKSIPPALNYITKPDCPGFGCGEHTIL